MLLTKYGKSNEDIKILHQELERVREQENFFYNKLFLKFHEAEKLAIGEI